MKVLMAAAIFGISFGMCGCSNEAKFAGMPMAATEAPASSPGATLQTAADAKAEVETPAVVNPPLEAPSNWVDVTTTNGTMPSTCNATPANCTMKDTISGLSWSNKRPDATWQGASDHCRTLNYNGVSGWRLPTQTELMTAVDHGIFSAARANWMTLANMQDYFWSASSLSDNTSYAWRVFFKYGYTTTSNKNLISDVVCVQ